MRSFYIVFDGLRDISGTISLSYRLNCFGLLKGYLNALSRVSFDHLVLVRCKLQSASHDYIMKESCKGNSRNLAMEFRNRLKKVIGKEQK